jgi:putative peptide zinc metalloprotease protein
MTDMTPRPLRSLAAGWLAVVLVVVGITATPTGATPAQTGDDNTAVAVNTQDGATVFRVAFSIRRVADGVVDQTNTAAALASCTDCRTIALAFQVVLVKGDADYVAPENTAIAYNEQCAECFTYASATQLVFGYDGPVRLTAEGWRRLVALQRSLRELEPRAGELTEQELLDEGAAAEQELVAIFTEEVVEVGPPSVDGERETDADPTTTTGPTTTTVDTTSTTSTTTTSVPDDGTSTTTTTAAGG